MARIEMSDVQRAEIAARSGAPDALFPLGLSYSTGRDRSPDLVDAHKWFNLAAMQGNGAAREYRADLAQEMSADEISEAQRRAREWLQAS
ncbi:MAG: sel1 repeat family protein [Gammaproteobacteria bacterium]|nr:sel1 repeat family protein [Gammaproteobacteria bacterium]